MNANEISPKANVRLNRIKNVSKGFRLFLQFGFPLILLLDFVGHLIWSLAQAKARPINMPQITPFFLLSWLCVLFFLIVALVTLLVWYWTSLKLFRSFEDGILFTEKTARYFKTLGVTFIIGVAAAAGGYVFYPMPDTISLSDPLAEIVSGIYNGIFFIFLGWVFGEAQKIREEQELTV
jgi:signal transduction histidine kinase